MGKTLQMTEGRPLKLLFWFALPLMFGNIFQQLYTVVDTAIVGKGVGMEALAALGTVDWFNWMMLGIAQGFTQGFSVRISQHYGKGDMDGLRRIIGQSVRIAVAVAVICTVIGEAGLPLFLKMLRVPEELVGMAAIYTRILLGGFSAIVFYNFCAAVLRAVGDSKTPLIAMVVASVTNIVLDCVTVFLLRWGIAGAAGATVFSQCVAGTVCAVRIWQTKELHFGKAQMKHDTAIIVDLIKIGTPVAAKNMIIALGGMTIQSIVNGFDLSFIAGYTASNKLYGLLEIAAISYGYAVTTYVGQNYGAQKVERIKSGMKSATRLSLSTSVLIAAIMIGFGRQITMLFISTEIPEQAAAAGEAAYLYLVIMSVSLPVLYLLYVYQAALQGVGNTMVTMIAGIIELALRVSLAMVVGVTGYANGIFVAEVSAWYGAAIFQMIVYYRMIRRWNPKQK